MSNKIKYLKLKRFSEGTVNALEELNEFLEIKGTDIHSVTSIYHTKWEAVNYIVFYWEYK